MFERARQEDAASRQKGQENFTSMQEALYGPLTPERRELFIPKIQELIDNQDASIMDVYRLGKLLVKESLKAQSNLDIEDVDRTYE
jgi:hypothetical protein